MGKIKTIQNRIVSDYLMFSRLNEYENIIKKSIEYGYTHITLANYYSLLASGKLKNQKYFIHRHDIDTDLRTTRKMFAIEKKHNIKTSYYFRLSTIDKKLMTEINTFGSEASYHFEEIATFCKQNSIHSKKEALKHIEAIKILFTQNFNRLEKQLGYKFESVASHGDFVNRKLNLKNNEITNDYELRKLLGINCEAYDKTLHNSFDAYISDKPYPVFYSPVNIFETIGKHKVICMLTHPRHWETNLWVNSFDNIKRVIEGLKHHSSSK